MAWSATLLPTVSTPFTRVAMPARCTAPPSILLGSSSLAVLVGLAAFALSACSDKGIATMGGTGSPVRSVIVTPTSLDLTIGQSATLLAAVDVAQSVTDRRVKWTSSNAAIAKVDSSGHVSGVAGGNAFIIATAHADPTVSGAVPVTVTPPASAPVLISQINQTVCAPSGGCTSAPATLSNVSGQLDVTVNVDPASQLLSEAALVMNCVSPPNSGSDTVVAKQTFGSSDRAPSSREASSAPLTLGFSTTALKNGPCSLRAKVVTSSGAQLSSDFALLTLNNP